MHPWAIALPGDAFLWITEFPRYSRPEIRLGLLERQFVYKMAHFRKKHLSPSKSFVCMNECWVLIFVIILLKSKVKGIQLAKHAESTQPLNRITLNEQSPSSIV
ncbi:MAG: hypothetical protein D6698_11000 [Gammaproteobacteria bacterium]|nr:MAG: hypothetical protein D6698_11000 [Gammaproteobacteria bacterium]